MSPLGVRSPAVIALLVTLSSAGQQAWAHQRSESFSHWHYTGQRLSVRFTVSEEEAQRHFFAKGDQQLQRTLAGYLADRVRPSNASGCAPFQTFRPIPSSEGYLQFVAAWDCPASPSSIDVEAFFELAAEHSHLISFSSAEGFFQQLLNDDQRSWFPRYPGQSAAAGEQNTFALFLVEGIRHIFGGADHIVFLLALLLVCRRRREVVWAITGFTLGHSASLALAVLDIVQPEIPAIEAAIGLTIALVAIERVSNTLVRAFPAALTVALCLLGLLGFHAAGGSEWRLSLLSGMALFAFCYLLLAREYGQRALFRMLITGLFGLIHGFGFAGAFLATDVPTARLAVSLAGFNIGVEIGQLSLVGLLVLVSQAKRIMSGQRQFVRETLAAVVCGLGTFWFVSRLFGS